MFIVRDWDVNRAEDYLRGRGLRHISATSAALYLTRDGRLTCQQDADAYLHKLDALKASRQARRALRPTILTTPDEDFGLGRDTDQLTEA
jgi:hypothetical protein